MVNSSWTEEHINSLWRRKGDVHKVFPPCDVKEVVSTREKQDKKVILSLGQFRPEKDHPLQIKAMFELRQVVTEEEWENVKLVIIGGVRNKVDEELVQDLKDLTRFDQALLKQSLFTNTGRCSQVPVCGGQCRVFSQSSLPRVDETVGRRPCRDTHHVERTFWHK